MRTHFSPKNNPRVIIIQKLYGKFYNEDDNLDFPKHRFKKFIKDIVTGTIERNDLILDELNTKLGDDFVFENLDKVFQTILKAATYEFMYKPQLSLNIIKIISVPGVFEIPVTISKNIKKYDAFLALGCVIKGQTPHFDFISQASTNAIMDISVNNKKPIGNGIITCLNMKQAKARKRKGAESAKAVISILSQR